MTTIGGAVGGCQAECVGGDARSRRVSRRSSCGQLSRRQPRHAHQVVRRRHEITRQLGAGESPVARPAEATDGLHPPEYLFNGLFTNDKFCWSRPARLHLKWWHRAYRDR